jgi:hypothetical protein
MGLRVQLPLLAPGERKNGKRKENGKGLMAVAQW